MKRIISLLLTLIMAMSSIPSAYAENSRNVFEIEFLATGISSDGYFSGAMIQNQTASTQTGVLVIATYSAEGQFLDFAYTDISVPSNNSSYYIVRFESRPTAFQKAFIWDGFGTFKLLSETHCLELSKTDEISAEIYTPQIILPDHKQFHTSYPYISFDDGIIYLTLADSVDVYVNGALYTTISPEADIEEGLTGSQAKLDAILSQAQGQVIFVRGDPEDFAFTEIYVNSYQIAEATAVSSNSFSTKISLTGIMGCIDTNPDAVNWDYILIENEFVESGDVAINVTKNGEACNLSSLKKGDIIAYAVDFTSENGLVNPEKIDIIATDSIVSGTVKGIDLNSSKTPDDNIYTINTGYDAEYKLIPGLLSDPDIYVKDSLNLRLDPFGRIYDYEIDPYATNYAIALKLGTEDNKIKLLLSNGTVKTYKVDTRYATNFTTDFVADNIDDVTNVADRVVTYEVSSRSGTITSIEKVPADKTLVDVEYKKRTAFLGSGNKILDITPMIRIDSDAEGTVESNNSSRYEVYTKDDLIDDAEYSGYVYRVGATVSFVVITGSPIFGENSRFAVAIDEPADALTEEGVLVKYVKVLYEGEKQGLYFTPAAAEDVEAGDVFFFETDSDGYVDAVYTPTEGDPVWEDKIKLDDWSYNVWDIWKTIQFAQGVVTEVTSNWISFASVEQVESGVLDTTLDLEEEINWYDSTNGIVIYAIAYDCMAYTYDGALKTRFESEKYDVTAPSSIKASDFSSFDNGNGVLNDGIYEGDLMSKANIATAMIVDGEIVAIFVIEK